MNDDSGTATNDPDFREVETPQIKAWQPSHGLKHAITHVGQLAADFAATEPFGSWSAEWRHHLTGYLASVIDQSVAYGRGMEKAKQIIEGDTEWRPVEPTATWPTPPPNGTDIVERIAEAAQAKANIEAAAKEAGFVVLTGQEDGGPLRPKKRRPKRKAKKAKQVVELPT